MKREKEEYQRQLDSGEWMNGFVGACGRDLERCENLCFELNQLPPALKEQRYGLIRQIVGRIGERFIVHSPFRCDLGSNIEIGENFISNYNLTILDETSVTIGDNVFIGPNVTICTIIHATEPERRNSGIMRALPVTIGNNVWIAANVTILPGVTIGDRSIIGAGSVVTKDIPEGVIAVGNHCKVLRRIDDTTDPSASTNAQ